MLARSSLALMACAPSEHSPRTSQRASAKALALSASANNAGEAIRMFLGERGLNLQTVRAMRIYATNGYIP